MGKHWEWFNRLGTTATLLCAIFGSSAVTAVIQAALKVFGQRDLPWWGYLLVAAVLSTAISLILLRQSRMFPETPPQISSAAESAERKLKIHSATYGIGMMDEEDVSARLDAIPKDALVVQVNNNALGCDPAPNKHKRLVVEYSYGTNRRFTAKRPENTRLVLPEDSWMLGRITELEEHVGRAEKEASQWKLNWEREASEVKLQREINADLQRYASKVSPRQYLIFQKSRYVPSAPESGDTYRNKVDVILTNGPKEIEIWTSLWESEYGVACQVPLASAVFPEGPKGYLANDYDPPKGAPCVKLRPGQSFKIWIGLLPPRIGDLNTLLDKRQTGTLIFPIKMEGKLNYDLVQI